MSSSTSNRTAHTAGNATGHQAGNGADLAPGSRLGAFRIHRRIGGGGMGVVYAATQESLRREVAVKVISPDLAHDDDFRAQFQREASAQGALASAYVPHLYAYGEADGRLYLAAQLIRGHDLAVGLRRYGVPSLDVAVTILTQVAAGLDDAHDAGLVHRDLKPSNVLVSRGSQGLRAHLIDFGVAMAAAEAAHHGGLPGHAVGTPTYMAPELFGGAAASRASDVYALGVLLHALTTGRPPYSGLGALEVGERHATEPVPPLATPALSRVLAIAMAKDPTRRYPTAGHLARELVHCVRGVHAA